MQVRCDVSNLGDFLDHLKVLQYRLHITIPTTTLQYY